MHGSPIWSTLSYDKEKHFLPQGLHLNEGHARCEAAAPLRPVLQLYVSLARTASTWA